MSGFLIVGLGNPSEKHRNNRHNIGFMAVDAIASAHSFSKETLKFGGALSEGNIDGNKILAFKPLSYMNVSGVPTREVINFYKIPPEKVVAIHDDLDLSLGKIRVKRGGGNGGHNGLKSLDGNIGKDYLRIRLGIDRPADKDMVASYVLSDFKKEEKETLAKIIENTAKHIDILLKGDEAGFMNKISLALQQIQEK